jgi:hypothetical protein
VSVFGLQCKTAAGARAAQVGRTKIITLHSGMWLENCTDRRVTFRLHTPISTLVAPAADAGAAPADARTDSTIGPLGPDEGAAGGSGAGANASRPSPYQARDIELQP